MTKIQKPITIILLISFFLLTTCTNDKTITGNEDQSVGKTMDALDINDTFGGDENPIFNTNKMLSDFAAAMWLLYQAHFEITGSKNCASDVVTIPNQSITTAYDFRDNFLSKSEKGEIYTICYYILSSYGIDNNLVNKYYKEHYELLKSSIEIAFDLQHSSNDNQILVNKEFRDDLKEIVKIYRNHPNHNDIEPVLQYLETDLVKYYNQPKHIIAADFEKN